MKVQQQHHKFWAALLILVLVVVANNQASAYPRTRTIKDHRRSYDSLDSSSSNNNNINSVSGNREQCERNVPCGWALYRQSSRSALRPIVEYTKNTLCDCPATTQCVYKENRSEMRAYVFTCRTPRDNDDLYRFPNWT